MGEIKPEVETFANIKVIGVGGSGNHAVNRMVAAKIRGVDFLALNTDVQDLHQCSAHHRLHIGKVATRGLGAGMDPSVGRAAAEESANDIRELLRGADMVFIACGLGGGTGSGASPVVASIAKELGALTIAVVTKPFTFEGAQRREIAEKAQLGLKERVDAIITIHNDRLLQVIDKKTSMVEAFTLCDDVLRQGVQGIAELITVPGLINLDFADVKAVMSEAGSAMMGIGKGTGDNRALDAAKSAVSSPLLEMSIEGARGILFTIAGSSNLTMYEVNEAAKTITAAADPGAKIIFGSVINENLKDEVRITVIASGFHERGGAALSGADEPGRVSYKPTPFVRKEYAAAEVERPARPLPPVAAPTSPQPLASEPVESGPKKSSEEEELEIPAFIRRRIKK